MNCRPLSVLAGFLVSMAVIGPTPAAEPLVPVPPGAKLLLEVEAQGVQIYACGKGGDGDRWTFSAPDAALFDATGRQIGVHFAGPSWQLDDGSKIVGEMLSQAPAPAMHGIPWLLLRVKSHEGNGALSDVSFVRRVDTKSGMAPSGPCTSPPARMRYTARYLFYSAPEKPAERGWRTH